MAQFTNDYEFNMYILDLFDISPRVQDYIMTVDPDIITGYSFREGFSDYYHSGEFEGYSSDEQFELTLLRVMEENKTTASHILYDAYLGYTDEQIIKKYRLTPDEF